MFNHWLVAGCALTFYIILRGGESAFRPRVSFTSLAFQASTFANSVISPLLHLAEEVDLETTQEDEVPLTTDFRGPPLAFRVTLPYGAGCPIRTGAALAGA